jgi:hypothetical protein
MLGKDRGPKESASVQLGLEHGDAVALAYELVGRSETGDPSTDHADMLLELGRRSCARNLVVAD